MTQLISAASCHIRLCLALAALCLTSACIFTTNAEECCDEWGCYECGAYDTPDIDSEANGIACSEDWECGPGCECIGGLCEEMDEADHDTDNNSISDAGSCLDDFDCGIGERCVDSVIRSQT